MLLLACQPVWAQYNFQKKIGGSGDLQPHSVCQATDDGYAVVGNITNLPGGPANLFVSKLDSLGNTEWTKTLGTSQSDFSKSANIIPLADSGFAVIGSYYPDPTEEQEAILIRLNKHGDIVWQKQIGCINPSQDNYGRDVLQLPGGDLMVATESHCGLGSPDATLARFTLSGDEVWSSQYGSNGSQHYPVGIEVKPDGHVAFLVNQVVTGSIGSTNLVKIFSVNPVDGTTHSPRVLYRAGQNYYSTLDARDFTVANNGDYLITGSYWDPNTPTTTFVLRIDTSGSLDWKNYYRISVDYNQGREISELPNGDIMVMGIHLNQLSTFFLDSVGQVKSAFLVNEGLANTLDFHARKSSTLIDDGRVAFVYEHHERLGTPKQALIEIKYANENQFCNAVNLSQDTLKSYSIGFNGLARGPYVVIDTGTIADSVSNFAIDTNFCFCREEVSFPDIDFCVGDSVQLNAGRGNNFRWEPATGLSCSDCPNPKAAPSGPTQYTVFRDTNSTCILVDSFTLTPLPVLAIDPDLGADSLYICSNESVTVNPGSYHEYLWQDSSITASYTIVGDSGSGWYFVRVQDTGFCPKFDSVYVSVDPIPTASFNPLIVVCHGDSLSLTINDTRSVHWWPNTNINCDTCSTIKLYSETPGTIYVSLDTLLPCARVDTFHYTTAFATQPNLGPDTNICLTGTPFTINGGNFGSYLWQDGSTDSTFEINLAGNYQVILNTIDANGCAAADTVLVSANYPSIVSLGADRTFCASSPPVLSSPGSPAGSYLWPDGSTGTSFIPPAPGTYWVDFTRNGCTSTDTVVVYPNPYPDPLLINDTTLCENSNYVLKTVLDTSFNNYLWSTGSTDSAIIIQGTEGSLDLYWLEYEDPIGCKHRDTVQLNFKAGPKITIDDDAPTLCDGETKFLSPEIATYDSLLWSTGEATDSIEVSSASNYSVTAYKDGCSSIDTFHVFKIFSPIVDVGEDIDMCEGDLVEVEVSTTGFVTWDNGSHDLVRQFAFPGTYWVGVSNECGFMRDTLIIRDLGCDCRIEMANVFTPNGDLQNDIAAANVDCELINYRLEIFNRWGLKVYEGYNPSEGWDGLYQGSGADVGVYFYTITANSRSEQYNLNGQLHLFK